MKKKAINGYLLAGLLITGALLLMTLIGMFYTPYRPTAMSAAEKFQAPSAAHWFGTDNFGRDIFSRVLKGSGTTLLIALATVAIGAVAGTLVGAVTGYFGGAVDDALMRFNMRSPPFPASCWRFWSSASWAAANTTSCSRSASCSSRASPASCGRSSRPSGRYITSPPRA